MGSHDKALTEEQKAKVDVLRKKGMSIKAISKELHIDDKRVSAFLKQTNRNGKVPCCKVVGKAKPQTKHRKPKSLDEVIDIFGGRACDTTSDFARVLMLFIMYVVKLLHNNKKVSEKDVHKHLDLLCESFTDAASMVSATTVMAMPKKFKEFWLANSHAEVGYMEKRKSVKKR